MFMVFVFIFVVYGFIFVLIECLMFFSCKWLKGGNDVFVDIMMFFLGVFW